jgi:hypothetical protein
MEKKTEYNGELRQLYLDLDKRIALSENTQKLLWETHDKGAKEREQYIHTRFHDVLNCSAEMKLELKIMMKLLAALPCEARDIRHEGIVSQLKALWWILGAGFVGIVTLFVKVFSGRIFG